MDPLLQNLTWAIRGFHLKLDEPHIQFSFHRHTDIKCLTQLPKSSKGRCSLFLLWQPIPQGNSIQLLQVAPLRGVLLSITVDLYLFVVFATSCNIFLGWHCLIFLGFVMSFGVWKEILLFKVVPKNINCAFCGVCVLCELEVLRHKGRRLRTLGWEHLLKGIVQELCMWLFCS